MYSLIGSVCVCVCMCVYTHTQTHTHTHARTHACTHAHAHTNSLSLSLSRIRTVSRTQNPSSAGLRRAVNGPHSFLSFSLSLSLSLSLSSRSLSVCVCVCVCVYPQLWMTFCMFLFLFFPNWFLSLLFFLSFLGWEHHCWMPCRTWRPICAQKRPFGTRCRRAMRTCALPRALPPAEKVVDVRTPARRKFIGAHGLGGEAEGLLKTNKLNEVDAERNRWAVGSGHGATPVGMGSSRAQIIRSPCRVFNETRGLAFSTKSPRVSLFFYTPVLSDATPLRQHCCHLLPPSRESGSRWAGLSCVAEVR